MNAYLDTNNDVMLKYCDTLLWDSDDGISHLEYCLGFVHHTRIKLQQLATG
jgi:hypothetical protein